MYVIQQQYKITTYNDLFHRDLPYGMGVEPHKKGVVMLKKKVPPLYVYET